MSSLLENIPAPVGSDQLTLVEQLVQWARRRIDERVFRPGLRMPSIRRLALDKGISRFTVVESYERLVALGYLEARRGSGFYVRERTAAGTPGASSHASRGGREGGALRPPPPSIDVPWLLNNMMHTTASDKGPGLGFLPGRWLDGDLLSNALKALGRLGGQTLLRHGTPQGFLPLRQQLQVRLAELEIGARPEQIVLTSGVTQAIDLISRLYVQPGDAVLVGDPAWFQMFGRFAAQGARLLGVPYTPEGPDLDALESLAETWRPKLLLLNSLLHNPTSTSLSAAQAHRVLQLAERYDFMVVEDDIFGDLLPATVPGTRLASLDQLRRVIYLSSFSKTLAPNLRVGYIACDAALAGTLADQKMLAGMTSPETGERIVYRILTEGHYRRHVEHLRVRLDEVRGVTARALVQAGLTLFNEPQAGLFLWADAHVDSSALTTAGYERGYLLAPGALFSPYQTPSTWMRFNTANCGDPDFLAFLAAYIQQHGA
ncbi:PLP-dependent aminotransferase family protein [Robbsia sp. Bb-Pol-6]|uniref:PLP-dependent aminotransferase family protein n=1 Tax=Robbsia betulipollinis TaxID=2981849 RepID=A0ABT3ZRT4_9BURK|nr:PLP-dependent aminotransferase family protein [Robbsia betulipollinis]MCY0388593.1 PLP-dependent aminotransferase family protein [Robbsia betulipollinis]